MIKKFLSHLRTYVIRGLLAIIPVAFSVLAVQFLYHAIDKKVMGLIDQFIGFRVPGLGLLLVFLVLYLLGLVTSNFFGKQILNLIERVSSRIPLVKTTYRIGKQIASTLSLPERQVFKRVVLVDYLKPGIWTVGFVTGTIIDEKNKKEMLLKVFVPTPPNPTSGTMVIVREAQTRDPGWTIEEALKAVISGGIIGPTIIKK